MTDAIGAFGILLKMGDGGSPTETFTTIAEVLDISGPSLSLETIEVTSHSSQEGWKEYIAGVLDGGEVSFELNFVPTEDTHDATLGLLSLLKTRAKRSFKVVFPDAVLEESRTTWSFSAYVTAFETSAPVADKLGASVTLKIAGKPTLQ